MAPPDVAGPHVPGEAVPDVVPESDGLLLVPERRDHDHRAEDLLLEDPRVGADVGEHRGLEVVPVREVLGSVPADNQAGAPLDTSDDVALYPVPILGPGPGAEIGGL